MAIILGGIVLNPNMLWEDRFGYSPVMQDTALTLGGRQVLYTGLRSAGRPITLTAIIDQGWLLLSQVQDVQSIAEQAGAQFPLVIGAESYTVCFRHNEPPAVAFQPLIPRAVPLDGDYFIGSIKLITV